MTLREIYETWKKYPLQTTPFFVGALVYLVAALWIAFTGGAY